MKRILKKTYSTGMHGAVRHADVLTTVMKHRKGAHIALPLIMRFNNLQLRAQYIDDALNIVDRVMRIHIPASQPTK